MKKIRINELARELEVKAHEILDRLPELGVAEKKTHSSSIDEDVAIKLRRYYGHEGSEFESAESINGMAEADGADPEADDDPIEESSAATAPEATPSRVETVPAARAPESPKEPESQSMKSS